MTEQNGGGVGLLDFDRDGFPDLFFANGARHGEQASQGHSQRLYRGLGDCRFEDVTTASGLESYGLGQGVAAADYDGDGFPDLFVAAYGRSHLWRNNGDGTFEDVTDAAGVANDRWGTSAAWADLDDDGLLDLYVVNYVDWTPRAAPCFSQHSPPVKISCSPTGFSGQPDRLFRNKGDGTLEDVGPAAGVAIAETGKGLALGIADFDGDDRLDCYVANDTTPNCLFRNLGDMKFADEAVVRGVAVSGDGTVGASMGVAIADYDADGRFDIAVTNFLHQPKDLYRNLGESGFQPVNSLLGLDAVTRPVLGFGIVLCDFDLDGWPDLFFANGHIWDLTSLKLDYAYRMPQQILRNVDGRRFHDVTSSSGEYFQKTWLGRAAAVGDIDNDGDLDLIVSQLDDPPAILRNDSVRGGKSLQLRLVGIRTARQPLGVRVEWTAGGRGYVTAVPAGGSFQATHDDRLILPLRDAEVIEELVVHWGPGRVERWTRLPVEHDLVLREGEAAPLLMSRPESAR